MTLLLDFDGTLNPGPYTSRFECNGAPTPEAIAAVNAYLDAGIEIVIFTARLSDAMPSAETRILYAIRGWISEHFGGWYPHITCTKHPGVILDDNAIRFEGVWPTVAQIAGRGTFTSPDDYKPEPDWKQAFMDAMEWVEQFYLRDRRTLEHPANAADYREIQRLRTLRDAAKGE